MGRFCHEYAKIPFLINGVTEESYWTNQRFPRRYKSWGENWMESPEFQAKCCIICGENITLADRIFSAGTRLGQSLPDGSRKAYMWTPKRFYSEGLCCSQPCSNELEQMTRDLQYPVFDRDKLLSLIRDFRISLGLEEGDTPTTFKPWDLILKQEALILTSDF